MNFRLHILLWSVYIIYESVIVGLITGKFSNIENYLIHYSINISVFYLHVFVLEKLNFRNTIKDYIFIIPLVILEMTCYVLLIATLNHFFTIYNQANKYNVLGIDYTFVLKAFYRCLFFIIIASGFWALRRYLKEKKTTERLKRMKLNDIIENEQMSRALVTAENAYLRSQINPHFLFNTLNFVHRRIKRLDVDSGEIILSLSKMMRYALIMDNEDGFSKLGDEIEQVENLINLFQIKENHTLVFHVEYEESVLSEKIIPLVLLTLTENMFKHGNLKDHSSPARISIRKNDGKLFIYTENIVRKDSIYQSNHLGLKNLKKRLVMHYSNGCSFDWGIEDEKFFTRLEILLN